MSLIFYFWLKCPFKEGVFTPTVPYTYTLQMLDSFSDCMIFYLILVPMTKINSVSSSLQSKYCCI